MRQQPSDAVATDYAHAVKRGGKRRMKDAVSAELARLEAEKKAQEEADRYFATAKTKAGIAECTCGWICTTGTVVEVLDRARAHSVEHGSVSFNGRDKFGEQAILHMDGQ